MILDLTFSNNNVCDIFCTCCQHLFLLCIVFFHCLCSLIKCFLSFFVIVIQILVYFLQKETDFGSIFLVSELWTRVCVNIVCIHACMCVYIEYIDHYLSVSHTHACMHAYAVAVCYWLIAEFIFVSNVTFHCLRVIIYILVFVIIDLHGIHIYSNHALHIMCTE